MTSRIGVSANHVHGFGRFNLQNSHSTELCGGVWYRSSKAPGCQDLDIEEPVVCRYASAFHFHPTLAGMLSSALIRDEVVQVCEPRQKRLLTATGMVKPFHGEQFPLDSVVSLI
jgi:hypothetical protein